MGIFAFCKDQEPQTECKNGIYHNELETRKKGQQEKKCNTMKWNERIYICAALIKDFRKRENHHKKTVQWAQ